MSLTFARTLVVRVGSALGSTLFIVVLARLLDRSDVGQFIFGFSVMALLSLLCRRGYDTAILRMATSVGDEFGGVANYALRQVALLSATVSSLGVVAAAASGALTANWLLLAVTLVPWSVMYVVSFLLKAGEKPALGSLFEAGWVNLVVALVVVAVSATGIFVPSVALVTAVLLAVTLVAAVSGLYLIRSQLRRGGNSSFPKSARREFGRLSRNFAVLVALNFLLNAGANTWLGWRSGVVEVANFAAANRISISLLLLSNVMTVVAGPVIARHFDSGDLEGAIAATVKAARLYFVLLAPAAVALLLLTNPILGVLGPEYQESSGLLRVLVGGQLLGLISPVSILFLTMTGRDKEVRNCAILPAVFILPLGVLFSATYGALAAVLATAGFYIATLAVATFVVWREFGIFLTPFGSFAKQSSGAIGSI